MSPTCEGIVFRGSVWACRHCLELVYQNCRYNRDIVRYKNVADLLKKKAETLFRKQSSTGGGIYYRGYKTPLKKFDGPYRAAMKAI